MRGSNLTITGSTRYNGSPDLLTITSAYVTQTDVLLPSLTVRETLLYAASLRLPSSTTSQQRSQLVEEVILELGLKECAATRIGDGFKKGGCSGGERRRVSIGVQMLKNPSVLFLDEPTTGLDATSAFHLVKTLKHLANTGRTIITTIHQPRSDIFFLFDRLTLLSRGNVAYTGPTSECLLWFDGLLPGGLKPHVNPADYLIDIVAVDTRGKEAEDESQARVNRLLVAWSKESKTRFASDKTTLERPRPQDIRAKRIQRSAPFLRQVQVLTSRTLLTTIRDPFGLVGSWSEAIFMGLVCGLVFYKIPHTLAGIRSTQAAFYLLCAAHSYLFILFEIYRLTRVDIQLYDRERGENLVSGLAWVVSRRIAHGILEDFMVPFLFCFIFSYLAGFQGDIGIFLAIVVLLQYITVTFALFCVAILRDFAWAALMANLFATVQTYGSGFFAQAGTIPVYVRWMKYVSYFVSSMKAFRSRLLTAHFYLFQFYGFGAASVNEFAGRYFDCPYGDARTDPACLQYRGSFVLENLSFSEDWMAVPLCALLGFVVFFLVSSCFILQFWTVDVQFSAAQTRSDDPDASAGKEVMKKSPDGDGVRKVDVELVDLALEIYKPSFVRGKGRTLNVLKSVSTKFQAGELNVILGPSGSGKSSLLNTMARRLRSSLLTRYRTSGAMLFNGIQPADKEVRSLCSYVTQDDAALLPYLTVRETLRFAAGLRLPKWMSKGEKMQRAEDVLLKMGLKDCADVLVGNELVKGISGGEKRRVSIAVQVLTEPQILM
jgi:ABC-type multidrug transport system ATPase subunit